MCTRMIFRGLVMACGAWCAASCATTNSNNVGVALEPEAPLPNSTPQTAIPMPTGIEVQGAIGCGQVAWYQVILPETRVLRLTVHGQAQESALGATATVAFVDAQGMAVLGQMVLPVFARSPNWDPREQQFLPPHPGTYFARISVDDNGCQRVALRVMLH